MEPVAASRRNVGGTSMQEYLMQGSIMDTFCEILLHRLRGLCDNADENPETFHDHEMVFQIRGPTGTPMTLRARESLDHTEMPWHLRYVGQTDLSANRTTLVRNVIDVDTSKNLVQFLNDLGFRLDYEFVLKGFMFRKGRMKVTVAKILQNNLDSIEPVSQSYLVELSVVAPSGQDALAEEMKQFSEQLKPDWNTEPYIKTWLREHRSAHDTRTREAQPKKSDEDNIFAKFLLVQLDKMDLRRVHP